MTTVFKKKIKSLELDIYNFYKEEFGEKPEVKPYIKNMLEYLDQKIKYDDTYFMEDYQQKIEDLIFEYLDTGDTNFDLNSSSFYDIQKLLTPLFYNAIPESVKTKIELEDLKGSIEYFKDRIGEIKDFSGHVNHAHEETCDIVIARKKDIMNMDHAKCTCSKEFRMSHHIAVLFWQTEGK
jgi:hypothetical protein